MSTRKQKNSLLIESHPRGYKGYPFITLIQYQDQTLLAIVDNMDDEKIMAYVLDFCGPEGVDEQQMITIAINWFQNHRDQYPISIEFAKHNMLGETSKLFRILNINYVTRYIGPANVFTINQCQTVKRRKRKPLPTSD
jgi:hypothetical protein